MATRGFASLFSAGLVTVCLMASPGPATAQDMNISLSRLREPRLDASGAPVPDQFVGDDASWRRVMSQFGGALIPPVLTPAGTYGIKGIYLGLESWITGISSNANYWFDAVEGDRAGRTRSRFVNDALVWGRAQVRKGLPFGFELGGSLGYLANTSYWALGLELRWALFSGFREDIGWIPDVAFRAAVNTMIGDPEFSMTVPSVELIVAQPIVIADTVELTPYVAGQWALIFADSEPVDLTPGVQAAELCDPDPTTPDGTGGGAPPYCRGDGSDLDNSYVFPRVRSSRWRGVIGAQVRYQWFTFLTAFAFDLLKPGEADGSIPLSLPRQWQLDFGVGASL